MSDTPVTPEQLASALAARLIHDVIGPASGIVSAFDLISDPKLVDMREEALALAATTARDLVSTMASIRTIYGGGEAAPSTADLIASARKLFVAPRAELTLRIDHPPTATSARVFLGLVQIMAGGVALGGVVTGGHTVGPGGLIIEFRAIGPRVKFFDEIHDGLAGRAVGAGKPHRWSAPYLIGVIARSTGGDIQMGVVEGGVAIRAVIKAEMA